MKLNKLVISFLFLLLPAMALAASFESIVTNPNKPILVKKGASRFTIKLKSNPTTGFAWYLTKYNNKFVVPIKKVYKKASTKVIGASGVTFWTFKVRPQAFATPHLFKITFQYLRPWEKQNGDSKGTTFTVITNDH